jgi:predicted nucleic acid-binding protein
MPTKSIVYIDSCGFIDVVKREVGKLPADREDDVWHVKQLLQAHRAGHVQVVTSYLTVAECVSVEQGQASVPEDVLANFRNLLNSGQYVHLLQQTPRTAVLAQNLRWKHNLVLGGADALHFAAAIEVSAIEFITTDDRLQKPKVAAAAEALAKEGLRLVRGAATLCLPDEYLQGEILGG